MARYTTMRPRLWWSESEYGWQERPTATVYEADAEPQETGLFDASGRALYRPPEKATLGFDLSPRAKPRVRVKAGRG